PRSHHPAWPGPGPPVPGVTLTTRTPSRSGTAAKSASVTPNGSQRLVRSLAAAAIARRFVRDRQDGRSAEGQDHRTIRAQLEVRQEPGGSRFRVREGELHLD